MALSSCHAAQCTAKQSSSLVRETARSRDPKWVGKGIWVGHKPRHWQPEFIARKDAFLTSDIALEGAERESQPTVFLGILIVSSAARVTEPYLDNVKMNSMSSA
jgi:hypothetical protein